MITRKDIAAHLDSTARTGLVVGAKSYTPLRSAFVEETQSSKAFELVTDMGAPPWPVQNAGKLGAGGLDARANVPVSGKINSGQQVQVIGGEEKGVLVYPIDWEVVIGVTHNSIDDDATGSLETWAKGASVNFQRHMDYLCFSALNAGDGSTYGNAYDNLSFFNSSHVDPGAEYQTAQDNLYGLALTLDNFRTVRVAASKFNDSRGQPLGLNHNLLVVPPDLEYEAAQICSNPEAYDTANREKNPYAGIMRYMVAPGGWFDATAWTILDVSQMVKPIKLLVRKAPALVIWDVEDSGDGGTRFYKYHARYNLMYQDWRTAVMGNS